MQQLIQLFNYKREQCERLFRGKGRITGKWFYGNLYDQDSYGRTHICTPERDCFDIDPATVGQITGFADKHGKKIFEDDILSDGSYYRVVIYQTGCFHLRDYPLHYTHPLMYLHPESWEVVGNIHDNPELIEKYIEYCKRHNL